MSQYLTFPPFLFPDCNSDFYPISRRLPLATACQVDDAYKGREPDSATYTVPELRAAPKVEPSETFDSIHFQEFEGIEMYDRRRSPTDAFHTTFQNQNSSKSFACADADGPGDQSSKNIFFSRDGPISLA